jgi:hypothetical protein
MAFDIPADLVQLQREWFAAETRWQEAAQRGDQPATDEAYLATQRLTMELHRHPWAGVGPAVQGSYGAS